MNTENHGLSRRTFLKHAAVASVVPLVFPGGLLRAETVSDKPFKLGFIGTGMQARSLMDACLVMSGAQVVAVCDVDTTRREDARKRVEKHYSENPPAEKYSGCTAFTDFRDLLARKDLDGVVIATPDHWHAYMAIAAAKAGKDVYCEKPLTHCIHEGRAIVSAVNAHRRILQVGSMQRSMPEFRAAAELVRNGVLGKVDRVEVAIWGPAKPCDLPAEPMEPGLDWDSWLGPAPVRPYNSALSPRGVYDFYPAWRNYREFGGGGITDWGAHHFDIVQWAFGFDRTGPVEILPAVQPDATSGVRFRYATGVEVIHLDTGNGIIFYGDKGKLQVSRGEFKLWLGDALQADNVDHAGLMVKQLLPPEAVRLYNSKNQIADWLNSMHTRKAPICDAETGHRTATVCHLVALAYYHHQRLLWNPAKEKFAGGTGDPKWIAGEHRSPWKIS